MKINGASSPRSPWASQVARATASPPLRGERLRPEGSPSGALHSLQCVVSSTPLGSARATGTFFFCYRGADFLFWASPEPRTGDPLGSPSPWQRVLVAHRSHQCSGWAPDPLVCVPVGPGPPTSRVVRPAVQACPARPHSITAVHGLREGDQAAAVSRPHQLRTRLSGVPGRVPDSPQGRQLFIHGGSMDGP
ncbi:hypothetical protein NDU88_000539 [Pleurodeles waltl]|uniref:Uncharacterized protein n=1 Tax=Pleurodeles waltl TaxID=8319 RepID=A0AAV7V977_PLEWA|nr:hypothetical protein NDU88_000539 [Pleurodeles waltl]